MKFLFFNSISGAGPMAARSLNQKTYTTHTLAPSLEEICFGHALGIENTLVDTYDVLVLGKTDPKCLLSLVKQYSPTFVIIDLGPLKLPKRDINPLIISLQLKGFKIALVKGLSTHTLGYNYYEDRAILIGKKEEEPVVLPAKMPIKHPFTPLANIVDLTSDETIIPFMNKGVMFHVVPRPWSFISPSRGDSYLCAHPLSIKTGAVWYGIQGKLHRLTVKEAAQIVGYPARLRKALQEVCKDQNLQVYTILRDISYPLWMEIFRRVII